MILVVCWLNRDPSWYSMDYRVYMGSSMIVWSLRWLSLYLCSYKLVSSATLLSLSNNDGPRGVVCVGDVRDDGPWPAGAVWDHVGARPWEPGELAVGE